MYAIAWPNASQGTLKNSTVRMWETARRPEIGQKLGEGDFVVAFASERDVVWYEAETSPTDSTGSVEAIPMRAGQGVSVVTKIQTVRQILSAILEEARAFLQPTYPS